MNTNRLSDTLAAALNKQMTNEAYAAQLYLSFGAWADAEGYEGVSHFLLRHSNEERNHMMKFLEYILKRGADVKVSAIEAPPQNPRNIKECLEHIFEHEVKNTTDIYTLAKLSFAEGDLATWNFMQWMVREQTEEETLILELLAKLKIAGGDHISGEALLELDKQFAAHPDDAKLAQDSTVANP